MKSMKHCYENWKTYISSAMLRLIHHTDKFPNIDVQVKNREKQLTKPLIRLFQNAKFSKLQGPCRSYYQQEASRRTHWNIAVFDVVWALVCEQQRAEILLFPATSTTPDKENYDIASRLLCEELRSALTEHA